MCRCAWKAPGASANHVKRAAVYGILLMNELLATQAFLGNAMLANSRLALANAVAWLDPSHILAYQSADEHEDIDDDAGEIANALYVCRRLFPDIYAGATQLAG